MKEVLNSTKNLLLENTLAMSLGGNYDVYLDKKFSLSNFNTLFTCPQENSNNYTITDLDEM